MPTLFAQFELDRTYAAVEINHFRAFCFLHLKETKLGIVDVTFGSTDRARRTDSNVVPEDAGPPGIKEGISGGAWETQVADRGAKRKARVTRKRQVGGSNSIGIDPVRLITISYLHDHSFIRPFPRLSLKDFDEASWIPVLNQSLAEKVKAIHVYSNGYKLSEYSKSEFLIDASAFDPPIPVAYTAEELRDVWARFRPRTASMFRISCSDHTPRRLLFDSPMSAHSLAIAGGVGLAQMPAAPCFYVLCNKQNFVRQPFH